jgi:aryl-alcohol dehydrogenase-like predicted oxidoreductase
LIEHRGTHDADHHAGWLDRLGPGTGPIPGTKRVKWLEQNVVALDVTLTPAELAILEPLGDKVAGARY